VSPKNSLNDVHRYVVEGARPRGRVFLTTTSSAAPSPAAPIPIEDYPFKNLGHHSRKVTTSSGDAQIWFDRGLAWAAGFNLEEARLCYEQAILADPNCLMAHFGLVGNCGPHYSKSDPVFALDFFLTTVCV
jgi:hypothetical protein